MTQGAWLWRQDFHQHKAIDGDDKKVVGRPAVERLRYTTATQKVGGSSPSVTTIRSVQLLGPWARPLPPHCSWRDRPLLSLINCQLGWEQGPWVGAEVRELSHQHPEINLSLSRLEGWLIDSCGMWRLHGTLWFGESKQHRAHGAQAASILSFLPPQKGMPPPPDHNAQRTDMGSPENDGISANYGLQESAVRQK